MRNIKLYKPLQMKSKKTDLTYFGDGLSFSHVITMVSAKLIVSVLNPCLPSFTKSPALSFLISLVFKNLQFK